MVVRIMQEKNEKKIAPLLREAIITEETPVKSGVLALYAATEPIEQLTRLE